MENKNVKRVVHVVSDMHRGGAETIIMNLYRNIDRDKLQFDFICHYIEGDKENINKKADYYDEIEKLGGRIFKVPSLGTSNPIDYTLNIKKVLTDNGPFEAIHVHTNKQSGFALLGARLARIKKRIAHSHTAEWINFNRIYIKTLKFIMKSNATRYCACGVDAGINAFDIKNIDNSDLILLNNAIDVNNFINIDNGKVDVLKKQLGIKEKTKVIGHVGRFDIEKIISL